MERLAKLLHKPAATGSRKNRSFFVLHHKKDTLLVAEEKNRITWFFA
ncbi:MAG: hypothetical protein HFG20_00260 [Anaerotruncus sp.]|nr:hypothetical protein [Anaerotruncus sp.]